MPAQTAPNLDDLLRVLNAATDRNTLRWGRTADEDAFRAELPLGMVRVAKIPPGNSYSLTLVDDDGTILDEWQPSGEGTLLAIESLYKKARNQALNLERKLQNLYDHLKGLAGES